MTNDVNDTNAANTGEVISVHKYDTSKYVIMPEGSARLMTPDMIAAIRAQAIDETLSALIKRFESIQEHDCKSISERLWFDGVLAVLDTMITPGESK